jgi:hypothetical protein
VSITLFYQCHADLSVCFPQPELQVVLRDLTDQQKRDEVVAFALDVRKVWSLGNYFALFQLYRRAPAMSAYIMNWFMPRERKQALRKIFRG